MNKKLQTTTSRQAFTDFASKLKARWRLNTTSTPSTERALEERGPITLERLLGDLVSLPTVTGNAEANHDGLVYIDEFLSARGMYTTWIDHRGVESLVATTRPGNKTPTVLLAAHLDVVPAEPEAFMVREENSTLRGRGVLDMKGAIATYLKIVDDLRETTNDYDFGIMITTDEEAGGSDGVEYLVEQGYLPKVCVLPDGGDNWQMQIFSKGYATMSISAKGEPAHGSRPWLGKNAIYTVMAIIQDIEKLFPELSESSNTFNIGKISGGTAINQVADYAEVLMEIRVTSEAARERLLKSIEDICDAHSATCNILVNGALTDFSLDDPYLRSFADLITEVTGVTVTGARTLGSNDTRFFAPHNVPCISFYPVGGGHHGKDEWIDTTSFHQMHLIIEKYLKKHAAVSVDSTRAVV